MRDKYCYTDRFEKATTAKIYDLFSQSMILGDNQIKAGAELAKCLIKEYINIYNSIQSAIYKTTSRFAVL